VPNRKTDLGKVFNGMQFKVTLETEYGTTATRDRNEPSSYAAEVTVKVKVPKPHHDLEEIKQLNASLPEVLPGLPDLLESAKVSPGFDNLYRLKVTALQKNLSRLDNLLTRHNFYDCETILELQHAQTKRRALFVQADMDVDTDGSDPDRVPEVDGASPTFQPFTSYRWGRKTTNPSSFVGPREAKIKNYEAELASGSAGVQRREDLRQAIGELRTEVSDLKKYSFLIGAEDPFIVLPGSLFSKNKGPFAPSVGDYCVVAYQKNLYPAIVGDVGPSNLIGEASLRICKEISKKSNSENRPISDLKVTYIVFPGTAEKFDTPDLAHWRERCDKFLGELGGYSGNLFTWEDRTKPKATPVPTTPVPTTPAPTTPVPGTPMPGSPAPTAPLTSSPKPASPTPTSPKTTSTAATSPKPSTPVSSPQPSTPAPAATPSTATPKP
jgi:hypothetical protein